MKLIVDIGNTAVKLAIFDDKKIIKNDRIDRFSIDLIEEFIGKEAIDKSIVCSVRRDFDLIPRLKDFLSFTTCHLFSHNTKVPIKSNYKTLETLGMDRLALLVGSSIDFSGKDVLILDAGTCLTVDYISAKGIHEGGRISPGLKMRYDALSHFTQKLPKLDYKINDCLIGDDTDSSIHTGVQQGFISEIDTIISQYRKENPEIIVIGTGGDYIFLQEALKSSIFADPFLLLRGLNEILDYNV